MLDQHNYPMPGLLIFDADRVSVLGEFGGIGQVVEGAPLGAGPQLGLCALQHPAAGYRRV